MSIFKKSAKEAVKEAGILFESNSAQTSDKNSSLIIQNEQFNTGNGALFEDILAKYNSDVASRDSSFNAYVKGSKNPLPVDKVFNAGMRANTVDLAMASFVTAGIVSGISFMATAHKSALSEAMQSAVSDATASAVMTGGLIDGGVALLLYAKGRINEVELKEKIVNTTAKSASTMFFSKAIKDITGKEVDPVVPFVVYTTSSCIFAAAREIARRADLEAEENDRLTGILIESKKQIDEYEAKLKQQIARFEITQKKMMEDFLYSFNYNLQTGEHYDDALKAIIRFADQAGIALQHASFNEFSDAMKRKTVFKLE